MGNPFADPRGRDNRGESGAQASGPATSPERGAAARSRCSNAPQSLPPLALRLAVLLATLIAFVALVSGPAGAQAAAACTASPTEVAPGETVTLDASASQNASRAEFDVDGDGTYELVDSTDFVVETQYEQPGTYEPAVRVGGSTNDSDTASCGTVTVARNRAPTASLDGSPTPAAVDEPVTLDASGSADADGTIVEYRWDVDGDGTIDRNGTESTIEHAYATAGSYRASVTVVDDDGANASATAAIDVEARPPIAACAVEPTTVSVGDPVTIDATGSQDADSVAIDVDGDGTIDRTLTASFETTVSYDAAGSYRPTATARNAAGENRTDCGELEVLASGNGTTDGGDGNASNGTGDTDGSGSESGSDGTAGSGADESGGSGGANGFLVALQRAVGGEGESGPGSPSHLGGTILLLGAVGWLLGRVRQASDDPRPRGVFEWRSDLDERFAAGLLRTNETDTLDVEFGFEPDLVLLTAGHHGGSEAADDQSSGAKEVLSQGVALRTANGIVQHAIGSERADGAAAICTEQGERTEADETEADLLRARVTETGETGFELACDEGFDAPICYRAIRFPADVSITVGTTEVAAGTESVELPETGPLDALLLDAVASADGGAVEPTSDGPIVPTGGDAADGGAPAWSVGTAVADGAQQTAIGQGDSDPTIVEDRALSLAEDGPRARVRAGDDSDATVLAYDEPATIEHVLQYVALSGVPALAPATGTFEVPRGEAGVQSDAKTAGTASDGGEPAGTKGPSEASETATIDLGFEPTFVEYWYARDGEPAIGTALADTEGIQQTVHGSGDASDTAGVLVESFTATGIAFAAAAWNETDAADGPVSVAYRAWPGPLGRRRDAGGADS